MKRLLISFLTTVTVVLALTGCGREFVINTAQVSAGVTLLDVQFGLVAQTVSKMDFSPAEKAQLEMAKQRIDELRMAAHDLVLNSGGVAQAVVKLDQVRHLSDVGRSAYITARGVICPNAQGADLLTPATCPRLAKLSPLDQETLIAFDQRARRTDTELQQLLNAPDGADITQTVSDVLTIGATAARIVQIGAVL